MSRPDPVVVGHFTHIEHIPTIMKHGLLSDAAAQRAGLIRAEVGNQSIKARRRLREVPVPPGGVVADYAPFYFAPRSPMMYVIHRGRLRTYDKGCEELVYLVSTVERLASLAVPLVFTDRNAVLDNAAFTTDPQRLDELVDWAVMSAERWHRTPEHPDRLERRMAECLVHESVPWDAVTSIVTKTPECAERLAEILATVGDDTPVEVRPDWYFSSVENSA